MKWLDLSPEERDAALNTVSQQLDIDTPSVEKDWWVTAVLRALFQTALCVPRAEYLCFERRSLRRYEMRFCHQRSV